MKEVVLKVNNIQSYRGLLETGDAYIAFIDWVTGEVGLRFKAKYYINGEVVDIKQFKGAK